MSTSGKAVIWELELKLPAERLFTTQSGRSLFVKNPDIFDLKIVIFQ
jgi:hypothetical protein